MKHIKSLMQKVGKGEGGFTLIELLIVIVILGIIAAVVVLNIGGFLGTGNRAAAYMEKDALQVAVMASASDGGCANCTATSNLNSSYTACAGAPAISKYFTGGTIKGTWVVGANCTIESGTYPPNCTWDAAAGTMICG